MKIQIAKVKDIKTLSSFYRGIIIKNPYYSKLAINAELKRFSLISLTKDFKDKENLFLIACDKNRIIGACNGYYEAGMFWVDWLVVDSNKRRIGIGLALMKFLEKKLAKEGIHKIWCDSRTINTESKSLLRKLGFRAITTIKRHWYNQDFILWQKFTA